MKTPVLESLFNSEIVKSTYFEGHLRTSSENVFMKPEKN